MTKIKNSVWGVFWQSIKLYFTNFDSFLKYMAFPVFGQIAGIIIILFVSYFYSVNLQKMVIKGSILDNFLMIFLLLFILTLPGLLILIKAFWDYLVAYGAVNSMLDNMLKSGKVYDFHAHTEVIARRSASYGFLWGVLAVLGLIALIPVFWIIAVIMFVYFILVFQVFAFEPDKSVLGCFQRSVEIIKGNFAKTLSLAVLIGLLTYWVMPELTKLLFNIFKITDFFALPFEGLASELPLDSINAMLLKVPGATQLTPLYLAKGMIIQLVIYVITSLTLPLRVICWGLWYKSLNKSEPKIDKRILNRAEAKD